MGDMRAFELPLHHADKEVWPLLRQCWRESSILANWCINTMAKHDAVRLPGMAFKDFPRFAPPDLRAMIFGRAVAKSGTKDKNKILPVVLAEYPGAEFFAGAVKSAEAVIKMTREKYARERIDTIWRRCKALPTYRDPQPWPVHNETWRNAWIDESGKPCVQLALPGGQVELRMRGGPEFGRQMAQFREVAELFRIEKERRKREKGTKPQHPWKQLVIYWQRCSESCHRPTCSVGGVPGRVMIKMVAELPLKERPGNRTLVLLTDPQAFWIAELDGRPAWVLNADHVRRITARHSEHLRRLQRMSEDAKAEKRLVNNRDGSQLARLELLSHKDRNRLASWTHESAAHLVGFAARQGVGELFYLDRDKEFMPKFPWFELRQKLSDKLKTHQIDFYSESGMLGSPVPSDDESPDGGDESVVDIRPTTPLEDARCLRQIESRVTALRRIAAGQKRTGSHHAVSVASAT